MKVITKGFSKPGGVKIQIEDWSENYPRSFGKEATLAAYPLVVSQDGMPRHMRWAYCPGFDKMRVVYEFPDAEACKTAFLRLSDGTGRFSDYSRYAGHDSAPWLANVKLD